MCYRRWNACRRPRQVAQALRRLVQLKSLKPRSGASRRWRTLQPWSSRGTPIGSWCRVGRLLMFVDAIEPGIPPYRDMGDFQIDSYISALEMAARLNVDAVMGGHTGPAPVVASYRPCSTPRA